MNHTAILILLGTMVPATQAVATPTTITTQNSQVAQPPITMPASIGKPHFCGEYYPSDAKRLGIQGETTIDFTVTAQGTVTDLRVKASSGDKSLDDAAVYCASQWLYKPAMKSEQPVAVPWRATVKWLLQ